MKARAKAWSLVLSIHLCFFAFAPYTDAVLAEEVNEQQNYQDEQVKVQLDFLKDAYRRLSSLGDIEDVMKYWEYVASQGYYELGRSTYESWLNTQKLIIEEIIERLRHLQELQQEGVISEELSKQIESTTTEIVEFVSHQNDRVLKQMVDQFTFGIDQNEDTPELVKLTNWINSGKSFIEAIQSISEDGVEKWGKDTFQTSIDSAILKMAINEALGIQQLDKELQPYGEAMADSLADVLSAKTPFDQSVAVINFLHNDFNLLSRAIGINESSKVDGKMESEEQVQSINRQVVQALQPIYVTDEFMAKLRSNLAKKYPDIGNSNVTWKELESKVTTDVNKVWTIKFSISLDPNSVNSNTVYVKDANGDIVDTTLQVENNIVKISPKHPYQTGQTYTAYIGPDIRSKNGKKLKTAVKFKFTVEDVSSNDNLYEGRLYNTLKKAEGKTFFTDAYGGTFYLGVITDEKDMILPRENEKEIHIWLGYQGSWGDDLWEGRVKIHSDASGVFDYKYYWDKEEKVFTDGKMKLEDNVLIISYKNKDNGEEYTISFPLNQNQSNE